MAEPEFLGLFVYAHALKKTYIIVYLIRKYHNVLKTRYTLTPQKTPKDLQKWHGLLLDYVLKQ